MRIVQLAAEFAPIAKAGGLGDVILGLSRELGAQHNNVEVVIPKYSFIDPQKLQQLKVEVPDYRCPERGQTISNAVWSAVVEDCPLRMIEARHPSGYFHRDKIYGCPDDVARFLYFSRAALEYLKLRQEPIDILHIHEWHTAACAVLLQRFLAKEISIRAVVFTIHNLEYQGKCGPHDLDAIGLDGISCLSTNQLQDPNPQFPQTINLMKGGIVSATAVNTVSPAYAKEILSPEQGLGLSPFLEKANLFGILNGIDTRTWDPATDPCLIARYSASDPLTKINSAKQANKKFLQNHYCLRCTDRPLFGSITRLTPQKGTDMIQQSIQKTIEMGGAFVLLASTPVPEIHQQFEKLREEYHNNPHVLLQYEYNEELAHQLYGALDFIMIPSISEPCGLTQLIALRYGVMPIVRSTGGLKDTIFDCEDKKIPIEMRNGFVFYEPTPTAINQTLLRAFNLYRSEKAAYQALIHKSMKGDYSWQKPAHEYLKLYRKVM
jgi:starch synthase